MPPWPLGWQPCLLTLHGGWANPPGAIGFPGPGGTGVGPDSPGCEGAPLGAHPPAHPLSNPSVHTPADPQALAAAAAGLKALLAAAGETVLERLDDSGQRLGRELPYGRIDGVALAAALPAVLERAGVGRTLVGPSP